MIEDDSFKYVESFQIASMGEQLKVLGSTGESVFVIHLIVVMLITGK